jgi:hypothetical protein
MPDVRAGGTAPDRTPGPNRRGRTPPTAACGPPVRRRRFVPPVRGCLGGDDLSLWERELSPPRDWWTPLILGVLVTVICVLVALIGIPALAVCPFFVLAGAAFLIRRLFVN